VKSAGGIPGVLWANAQYPNSTITLFPVPAVAMTLNLVSQKAFKSFATLTTNVALPPGYEDLITYNLAVRTAPEFDVDTPPDVKQMAASTMRAMKRINTVVPVMNLPVEVLPMGGGTPYDYLG
jgi:hypothetical protein